MQKAVVSNQEISLQNNQGINDDHLGNDNEQYK